MRMQLTITNICMLLVCTSLASLMRLSSSTSGFSKSRTNLFSAFSAMGPNRNSIICSHSLPPRRSCFGVSGGSGAPFWACTAIWRAGLLLGCLCWIRWCDVCKLPQAPRWIWANDMPLRCGRTLPIAYWGIDGQIKGVALLAQLTSRRGRSCVRLDVSVTINFKRYREDIKAHTAFWQPAKCSPVGNHPAMLTHAKPCRSHSREEYWIPSIMLDIKYRCHRLAATSSLPSLLRSTSSAECAESSTTSSST